MSETKGLSRAQWLVLAAAFLGWMFDGVELGLFPLVARPGLQELLRDTGDTEVGRWNGVIVASFLFGAALGGLLFGWIGDKLGRVRAMVLSVLTYSIFTGLGALAGQAWHLAVLRFIAALGMGGEWAVGVALVVECWPERHRPKLAGAIGAAANFGFLLIGIVAFFFPVVSGSWRWFMAFGACPALLALLIIIFVPESDRWKASVKAAADRSRAEPDGPRGLWSRLRPALIFLILAAMVEAFLAIILVSFFSDHLAVFAKFLPSVALMSWLAQLGPDAAHLPQQAWPHAIRAPLLFLLLPLLIFPRRTWRVSFLAIAFSAIPLVGTWAAVSGWIPLWVEQMRQYQLVSAEIPQPHRDTLTIQQIKERVTEAKSKLPPEKWHAIQAGAARAKALITVVMATGAILFCFLAPMFGDLVGRRPAYFVLCILSLGSCQYLFGSFNDMSIGFWLTAWFAGGITAAFYGWLPLYLPELFPTAIRATGQGLAFNFGRILAALGTLYMGNLVHLMGGDYGQAMAKITLIYAVGMLAIWFAPETRGRPLPE